MILHAVRLNPAASQSGIVQEEEIPICMQCRLVKGIKNKNCKTQSSQNLYYLFVFLFLYFNVFVVKKI
jgi:hypothetical protein